MGMYIPQGSEGYMYAKPNGKVGNYSWSSDHIDLKIFQKLGVWRPREVETALLQSRILKAIQPSSAGHWSELDYKTFWEWVDDYELHT